MDKLIEENYLEDQKLFELKILLREPSFLKKYHKFKKESSQYIRPVHYGFKIGLLSGLFLGSIYGVFKTYKTQNIYYIPVSAIVYGGVLGLSNGIFYLIRS